VLLRTLARASAMREADVGGLSAGRKPPVKGRARERARGVETGSKQRERSKRVESSSFRYSVFVQRSGSCFPFYCVQGSASCGEGEREECHPQDAIHRPRPRSLLAVSKKESTLLHGQIVWRANSINNKFSLSLNKARLRRAAPPLAAAVGDDACCRR
jgi:hypothetical protein